MTTSCESQPKPTQGDEHKKDQFLHKRPTRSDDVAQVMWHSLTPIAKKKIKVNVSNSSDPELNKAFQVFVYLSHNSEINNKTWI